MGKNIDYNQLSNAEIRIKMQTLEHEYEAKKIKLQDMLNQLSDINDNYLKLKEVLNKRSKGFM